jgi:urea transport system permease protein
LQLETDAGVKSALQLSLIKVESRLAWGDRLGAIFSGISLGSILLLVALGLGHYLWPDGRHQHGAW